MSSNSNQMNPLQHPLEAIATGIAGATSGEARAPRISHVMSTNEGPADIIAKVSGHTQGGKREDDGREYTRSNWGESRTCIGAWLCRRLHPNINHDFLIPLFLRTRC